jgi:acyl carrier protein
VSQFSGADVLEKIRIEAKSIAPDVDLDKVEMDTYIADIGIDSLQTLELIARLEGDLGVALPDYELAGIETVGDLIRVVRRAGAEVT